MNRIKRTLSAILFLQIIIIAPHAQTETVNLKLTDVFTMQEIQLVKSGKIITYAKMNGKGEASTAGAAVSFPRLTVSAYDNPSGYSVAAVEKAFFKGDISEWQLIFDKLGDYPAFKGMQYYSLSEGKAKTLIPGSWLSGEKSLFKSGDMAHSSGYFTIRDNRLGTIPFRGEVHGRRGSVYSVSVCSGQVSRFGMRIFEPGDYRVYKFFVYDKSSGGWFYCSVQLMMVRSDIMRSLDLLKPENICNRLRGETLHLFGLIGHGRNGELAAFR